jgi:hypothetical protein
MISVDSTKTSAWDQTVAHIDLKSPRHAADKAFFDEKNGSCKWQPYLHADLPGLQGYRFDSNEDRLVSKSAQLIRKLAFQKDDCGRPRKAAGYKIVISPTDRTQGYLFAIQNKQLQSELLVKVYWFMVQAVARVMTGTFLAAAHNDTPRLHAEMIFNKYDERGKIIRKKFSWDRALFSALGSRFAAGFAPDFSMQNPRWNTVLSMKVEKELIAICKAFYRHHGLDEGKAEEATKLLQSEEARSKKGIEESEKSKARRQAKVDWDVLMGDLHRVWAKGLAPKKRSKKLWRINGHGQWLLAPWFWKFIQTCSCGEARSFEGVYNSYLQTLGKQKEQALDLETL